MVDLVELAEEILGQFGNVLGVLAQGRHLDADPQPIEQVVAEASFLDFAVQLAVGGGYHADIDSDRVIGPQGAKAPRFQDAQQLGLALQGQLANLVQEQGPLVGQLEVTGTGPVGPGEGPFFMTEQLGLGHGGDDGGTVDRHQGSLTAGTLAVQAQSDQFLADSAFAADQHGTWRVGQQIDLVAQACHGLAGTDQFLALGGGTVAQPGQVSFQGAT